MGIIGFFIAMVMCFAMLAVLGAGIGLGLFAAAVGTVLTALGVVSSSAALGFLTKRPAVAVRALLLQIGVLAGIPAGAVAAWAGNELYQAYVTSQGISWIGVEWKIPLLGAVGGAFAGVILALLLDFILRRSHAWLAQKTSNLAAPARGTESA